MPPGDKINIMYIKKQCNLSYKKLYRVVYIDQGMSLLVVIDIPRPLKWPTMPFGMDDP